MNNIVGLRVCVVGYVTNRIISFHIHVTIHQGT